MTKGRKKHKQIIIRTRSAIGVTLSYRESKITMIKMLMEWF